MDYSKLSGLIPAVIQDADTSEVLMVGFMNEEALARTRASQTALKESFNDDIARFRELKGG